MKTILLSCSLILSTNATADPVNPSLARAPIFVAGLEAAHTFAADFEKENGKPLAQELIGFSANADAEEIEVKMLSLSGPAQLASDLYGCHLDKKNDGSVEEAHCHSEGAHETTPYTPGAHLHSLAQFEEAAVEAVEFFTKKFGPASQIQKLKMWQTGENFELAFDFMPSEQSKKTIFMMCHPHGGHLDCHTQSRPGQNEPRS